MPENPRWFSPPAFGMTEYSDLFTNRQLTALTTFSALVAEAQAKAEADAVAAGVTNDHIALSAGGFGARAYGEAVGVYLSFVISKLADRGSSICSWDSSREGLRNTFGRQAIPMVWDYAEANPFSNSSGCFDNMLDWVTKCIVEFPAQSFGEVSQFDAQSDCGLRNIMVSSDPPYYDNIGYADLSDFFYVWMRQSLKETYPKLFRTMLVPKAEELVATPYRFEGSTEKARDFFEDGMLHTCQQIYQYAREDVPVTIYYAYKQSDTDEREAEKQTASTGWETMLSAIIKQLATYWHMAHAHRNGKPLHCVRHQCACVLHCAGVPQAPGGCPAGYPPQPDCGTEAGTASGFEEIAGKQTLHLWTWRSLPLAPAWACTPAMPACWKQTVPP